MSAGASRASSPPVDARYFLLGDGSAFNGGTRGATGASAAIAAACRTVSLELLECRRDTHGRLRRRRTLYPAPAAASLLAAG